MIELLKDLELGLKTANDKEEREDFLSILTNKEFIDKSKANDEERAFIERLEKQYLGTEKKETPKTEKKETPKAKTKSRKTAKKTPKRTKAENDKVIKEASGKTLEECKEILAKYEALRGKTTEKDKKRIDKLDKDGKLIEGTQTKTAESTTETTTKVIPKKIKQEVDAIEKEAEAEAKKEVDTKGKTKTEVKKEVEKVTKEKIEEKVEEMTSDLADAGKKFLKSIQSEIKKYSKDDSKKFLLDIKAQIDKLLKEFGFGGEIVETYAIPWSGGGRPMPTYAKGGKVKYKNLTDSQVKYLKELGFTDSQIEEADYREGNRAGFEKPSPFINTFAKGGKTRSLRSIRTDRARLSQEPWEEAYLPKRKGSYYADGGFIPNAIHTFGGDKEMVMVLEEYPNGYFEVINKAGDIKNVHHTYITTLDNYKKFAKGGRIYPIEGLNREFGDDDFGGIQRYWSDKPEGTFVYAYNEEIKNPVLESDKHILVKGYEDYVDDTKNAYLIIDKNKNTIIDYALWDYEDLVPIYFNRKFAKGGRTKIEFEGVEFTPEMYKGIMGDKDKDGVPNADDVEPSNPSITEKIEENTPFTETFNKLLTKKKKYDDTMYSIVDKMEKNLPEKYNIIARTKTPFSILKKLVDKRIDGANGLDDIIGTTIATNNNKELREVSSMIGTKAGDEGIFGKVIEIDDKFKKPKCGYTAIHYIVEYEGRPVEVQLKTKRMKKLNEFSHPFYKREDLDCDGMGELSEIVTMADNGSEEAKKEFDEIYANKELMRSMISLSGKKFAEGGEVEWFDYSNIGLKELPFDLDRYFIKTPDTVEIDLDLLEPTRAREKGVKNANKYMRMAYDGEMDRRKPISVYERDGRFFVYDGNSTIANAKNSGWDSIYVEMMDDPNEEMFQDGGVIEIDEDFSNVPAELMEVFGMMDIDEEGSYSEMERLREMARKRGYDFDYDLAGHPIDYWTIPKEYMARGGRTKHSLMQDRRRISSQSWEQAYQKRKRN